VELTGGVEDELSPAEAAGLFPGSNLDISLVHVQQLPEVVALPGEGASGGIFKIVYRINLLYQQRPVGNQGLIIHGVPPCGFVWVFLSGESQTMPSRPEQRVDVS
jgi:hypothetical protein